LAVRTWVITCVGFFSVSLTSATMIGVMPAPRMAPPVQNLWMKTAAAIEETLAMARVVTDSPPPEGAGVRSARVLTVNEGGTRAL
jgi:hypothetical protein